MRADSTDTLFKILADPTRRRILDLLAEEGPLNVSELSAEFPDLVASGISKHLMGLRSAGLVHADRDGRQQIYSVDARALAEPLAAWLEKYERFWGEALRRLRELAERDADTRAADGRRARTRANTKRRRKR